MYIPPVKVFSPIPIEGLVPREIADGVRKRLKTLTWLFCPENELPPDSVSKQLKVESTNDGDLLLRWRPRMRYPPRMYNLRNELDEQISVTRVGLKYMSDQSESTQMALNVLDECVDGVGFIRGFERDNMGFPVVMAAASTIAEMTGGAIATNGFGWFVPDETDLKCIHRSSAG